MPNTCLYAHVDAHAYTCLHARLYTYLHMRLYTYLHMRLFALYTRLCTYLHTCLHTHRCPLSRLKTSRPSSQPRWGCTTSTGACRVCEHTRARCWRSVHVCGYGGQARKTLMVTVCRTMMAKPMVVSQGEVLQYAIHERPHAPCACTTTARARTHAHLHVRARARQPTRPRARPHMRVPARMYTRIRPHVHAHSCTRARTHSDLFGTLTNVMDAAADAIEVTHMHTPSTHACIRGRTHTPKEHGLLDALACAHVLARTDACRRSSRSGLAKKNWITPRLSRQKKQK